MTETKKHQLPFPHGSQSQLVDLKRCRFFGTDSSLDGAGGIYGEGGCLNTSLASLYHLGSFLFRTIDMEESRMSRMMMRDFLSDLGFGDKSKRWWFSITKLRSKRVKWASGWGLRTSQLTYINNKICISLYVYIYIYRNRFCSHICTHHTHMYIMRI